MPLVGNIEDLKFRYAYEGGKPAPGQPMAIDTPYMEVRVIVLEPGVYPPYHAHHTGIDEGYLIHRGSGLIHNSGETFEVREGNVLLNPRGGMHHMKNVGEGELIEFNFRGGRMPSEFNLPEGDPPPNPDPETVGNLTPPPVPYVLGNVEEMINPFDEATVQQKGLPMAIATEHLELRIVSFAPGDMPPVHRHHKELDEATLILKGRLTYIIEGEALELGPGDLAHVPGGLWHQAKNESSEECAFFNFAGGKLPVRTEWK